MRVTTCGETERPPVAKGVKADVSSSKLTSEVPSAIEALGWISEVMPRRRAVLATLAGPTELPSLAATVLIDRASAVRIVTSPWYSRA